MSRQAWILALLGLTFFVLTRPRVRAAIGEKGATVIETVKKALDPIRRAIEREEGNVPHAYLDEAGRWTIGIGHLIQPHEQYLMAYTKASPAPAELVNRLFERDISSAYGAVDAVGVPLSDNQRAALVSLVFNIGTGAFGTSTLRKKLKAGDYAGAAAEMLAWRKITRNGVKQDSPALLARRERERELFMTA